MFIKLGPFGGLVPGLGKRLLPDAGAQVCSNLKLDQSGELHPLNSIGTAIEISRPMPPLSIFKARSGESDSAWMSWPIVVDAVRVPLSAESEALFCWSGDGAPQQGMFSHVTAGGGNDYPASSFMLGVPNPQTAPSVTPSGGAASDITRFYCYTFRAVLTGADGNEIWQESGPSPVSAEITGKPDGTWALSGLDEVPTNSGTGTASHAGGYTTFTNAATARHWLRVGDEVVIGGDTVSVTAIPAAHQFKVAGDYSAETTWERRIDWNTTNMVKLIYRTTGSLGSWQLVNETGLSAATTTYNDTLLDDQIAGDELITSGWEPPPVGLHSLYVHSSGALAGILDNILCMSEPYQPHAWLKKYRLSASFRGVGLSGFGSAIVMATEGKPFVAAGVSPGSISGEDAQGLYPCVAKRSVISDGEGVLYASKPGIVFIGSNGAGLFTQTLIATEKAWTDLNPSSMIFAFSSGVIFISYISASGARQLLMIAPGKMQTAAIGADGLYNDPATNDLYVTTSQGIHLFDDPSRVVMTSAWRSKEFVSQEPVNLGAAKIDFELAVDPVQQASALQAISDALATNAAILATGNANGSINASQINGNKLHGSDFVDVPENPANNSVTFNLYAGGVLRASRVVSSTKAFRLPDGYKSDTASIEIITQCPVKEVRVAETMSGLKQG